MAFRDTDLCRKQRACEARRSLGGREDLGYCRGGTIKIRDYRGVGGCGDAEPRKGRDTELSSCQGCVFLLLQGEAGGGGEGNPE